MSVIGLYIEVECQDLLQGQYILYQCITQLVEPQGNGLDWDAALNLRSN